MGKGTKVAVKIKGTVKGVTKALAHLAHGMPAPVNEPRLREADFRKNAKNKAN
jgi:hypothetical protein